MGIIDAPITVPRRAVPGCLTRFSTPTNNDNLSNGTDTAANFRSRFVVIQSCHSPQFAFANWYCSSGNETDGLNDITVRASLETSAGLFVPLYFGGARDVVIGPGGTVWSDPVGVDLRFGDIWKMRTYVTCAAGGKWPRNVQLNGSSEGGELGSPITVADKTTSGTIAASAISGFAATAVRATPGKDRIPVIGVVGDSVACGAGVTTSVDRGWIRWALNGQYATQMVAFSSDTANSWTDDPAVVTPSRTKQRRPLLNGCTHVVSALGRNSLSVDVDNAAGLAVLTIALWNWLKRRGFRTWQATVTPQTTSTDGWVTTGNQTVADVTVEARRIVWNTWIRDGAPLLAGAYIAAGTTNPAALRAGQTGHPLSGTLDPTLLVESALNSGIWKAAHTGDGTHPNDTGMAAMAPALDPTIFGPIASA